MAANGNRTIYVGGLPQGINEEHLVSSFSCFGDIVDVQIPRDRARADTQQDATSSAHRGFGFLVFATSQEAQDAVDNMHLNELYGRVLNVNLAKPLKTAAGSGGGNRAVWEDEEWIKQYAKPAEAQDAVASVAEAETIAAS